MIVLDGAGGFIIACHDLQRLDRVNQIMMGDTRLVMLRPQSRVRHLQRGGISATFQGRAMHLDGTAVLLQSTVPAFDAGRDRTQPLRQRGVFARPFLIIGFPLVMLGLNFHGYSGRGCPLRRCRGRGKQSKRGDEQQRVWHGAFSNKHIETVYHYV